MTFSNFSGYVLAGGKSSRLKTDKAFLEIEGETFLARAVKTLSSVCENRVKVVLNQTQTNFIERIPDRIPHIFDVYENRGALGGIHAALRDCKSEWTIILAVDLPLVSNEAIANLAKIALELKTYSLVVPMQNDGRQPPLCAVYRAEACLPKLEDLLIKSTSASVRKFLELAPAHFVKQDELPTNADNDLFFNINRPTDFEKLSSPL